MPMNAQVRARLAAQRPRPNRPVVVEGLEARQLLAFTANINFQPSGGIVPSGYLGDFGSTYAKWSNGLTYGWSNNNSSNTRDRNSALSPDDRYDTFAYSQRSGVSRWDLAVTSGVYNVRVVSGDPTSVDAVYGYNAEGKSVSFGTPTTSARWVDGTALVKVSDGKLTLTNAANTRENKINFLTVSEVVPEGLRAMAASNSKIALTWNDVMFGEAGYRIERSTDGVNFSSIATVASNETAYTDTGRTAGVQYTYRVKAMTAVGDSAPSAAAAAKIVTSGLNVAFDATGISKVSYKGETLFDAVTHPYERLSIYNYTVRHADGTVEQKSGAPLSSSFDAAMREATWDYAWGTIACKYIVDADQLKIDVTITNTHSTDTITAVTVSPVTFRFPEMPDGFKGWPQLAYNVNGPTVVAANYESGQVVITNDDVMEPLTVGFMSSNTTATEMRYNVLVSTANASKPTFQRAVGPQQSDTHSLSLRFGYAGASVEALAGDVYQRYVSLHPSTLNWDDRRAIGMIFMPENTTQGFSLTNPHGWFGDPKVDTVSPLGLAKWRERFLAGADLTVSILRQMNAQGAVVWDLEGEQYKGGIYVGDPRVATTTLPEYNYNNTIDEYFRKFTNAGLKVGVTLRPTQFQITGPSAGTQIGVADPAKLMIDKVRYARDRWGVRMFYIDSNDPTRPQDIAALAAAFPDTLFIPENDATEFYRFSAPYGEVRGGHLETPPLARTLYPTSFSVIESVNGPIADYRAQLVDAVRDGNVLMFQAWYNSANNTLIKSIYDEAYGTAPR
jgi:hypothetical protein